MSLDPDFLFALQLQKQFEQDTDINSKKEVKSPIKENTNSKNSKGSLIDLSWELIDPTPNIYNLFIQFDKRFFWNKLTSVAVKWSKRMTSCAGVCSYEGRGGMCSISLSEPLLKLRPRKDLIETLLHEMIHAFLFVTHNNRDRDGHGPEFHKHMYRINQDAGTKITVYHSFHDEVDLYKTHWWRCNGVCRDKKPYFGVVKRASNRKPGPNDFWWNSHQLSCGGTFIKIREPTKKTKPGELAISSSPVSDIRNFMTSKNSLNKTSTITSQIMTYKDLNKITHSGKEKEKNGSMLVNNSSRTLIINSKNVNTNVNDQLQIDNFKPYSGKGHKLSLTSEEPLKNEKVIDKLLNKNNDPILTVRNHWAEKFNTNKGFCSKPTNEVPFKHSVFDNGNNFNKKRKLETEEQTGTLKISATKDKSNYKNIDNCVDNKIKSQNNKIKSESVDILHLDSVVCPVCSKQLHENEMNQHLDKCLESNDKQFDEKNISCLVCGEMIKENMLNEHLEECIGGVFDGEMEYEEHLEIKENENVSELKLYDCPCCPKKFSVNDINQHLDFCLSNNLNKK